MLILVASAYTLPFQFISEAAQRNPEHGPWLGLRDPHLLAFPLIYLLLRHLLRTMAWPHRKVLLVCLLVAAFPFARPSFDRLPLRGFSSEWTAVLIQLSLSVGFGYVLYLLFRPNTLPAKVGASD